MSDDLFHDDGRDWLREELTPPPKPGRGYYLTCSLTWLARVLPIVRSPEQLAVALMIYRRCVMQRCRTVVLPNGELSMFGISRYTKYRALARLREAGAVSIETCNGRSIKVALHWFP